ncbi:hypothetical protein E2C01_000570 [Portunus trituberculatus]|uniref:Uncharacterized protein n=1 Tax=Portunus trituberculatus TaxID=210409 RepID=A0A5B7CGX4_PORTR|nr:hypothetical protein [Portunus trituberculatus]
MLARSLLEGGGRGCSCLTVAQHSASSPRAGWVTPRRNATTSAALAGDPAILVTFTLNSPDQSVLLFYAFIQIDDMH